MQVSIDVTCMYTEFGGRGLPGFGDTATLKNGQISLLDHGGQKLELAQKIMQVEVDDVFMCTKF